jgi:hypothetical protein
MKRLKEENKRIREIQNEAAKRIAGFEKNARKQDSEMRRLQIDMEHKSQQLKRKNEEVQKLKEKTKVVR